MVHSSIDKTDSVPDEDQMESNEKISNEEETDKENDAEESDVEEEEENSIWSDIANYINTYHEKPLEAYKHFVMQVHNL